MGEFKPTDIFVKAGLAVLILGLCLFLFGCIGNNVNIAGSQEAWKKIGVAEEIGKGNAARIGTAEKTKTTVKGDVISEKDADDSDDSFIDSLMRGMGI
jgi:hypothetical protein